MAVVLLHTPVPVPVGVTVPVPVIVTVGRVVIGYVRVGVGDICTSLTGIVVSSVIENESEKD